MNGKTVLIVGSTSGIGEAAAIVFAKKGWLVIVSGRDVDRGEEVVRKLPGNGHLFVQVDVTDAQQVESLFRRIKLKYQQLDAAFNSAGILGNSSNIPDMPEVDFRAVINTNLVGTFHCLKHEMQIMSSQGRGSIVNCSSIGGVVGMPGISAYVASKHAIIGLTKSAALEKVPAGVRINSVSPGATMTPMQDRMMRSDPSLEVGLKATHPLGRIANPEEIANAVYWLCSPESSFITGTNIIVDGGFTAK